MQNKLATLLALLRTALSTTIGQIVASFVVLSIAAASVFGIGAHATFNSNQTVSQSVSSASVTITLGTNGTSANRLNVAASNIAPGDTIQRSVDIINGGTHNLSALSLSNTATTSSALDTDTTNGLQMTFDECSVAWTESGSSPNFTYTCGGTLTNRVASSAIIQSNTALAGAALTTGSTGHYRVTVALPSSAGSGLENLTSVIQYSFTGTQ